MSDSKQGRLETRRTWVRIPDGTMVRHRREGHQGFIDGLTELAGGPDRNPDGRTQYRINIGESARKLAVEDDLLILTDADGVILMLRQKVEYRSCVSKQLHDVFAADRFLKSA